MCNQILPWRNPLLDIFSHIGSSASTAIYYEEHIFLRLKNQLCFFKVNLSETVNYTVFTLKLI
jgi:hypothetical protein